MVITRVPITDPREASAGTAKFEKVTLDEGAVHLAEADADINSNKQIITT
ncbi:hypothetical protein YERSI8AC_300126 [Enterobacterales bacterium 8AC]|nr:hypothetical protein YERSI8AC_300126 [Enterobacterales bacterium 8AC]